MNKKSFSGTPVIVEVVGFVAPSSSGLGHHSFKVKITGSNPVGVTKNIKGRRSIRSKPEIISGLVFEKPGG